MDPVATARQACVLLDSNIWFETQLLRTHDGRELLSVLESSRIRLALPEIVEREVPWVLLNEAENAWKVVRRVFGSLGAPSCSMPAMDQIREATDKRYAELHRVVERVPISDAHLRRALDRVIEHIPPARKKEAFKDCLIWEAVLDLVERFAVHVVTKDKDFFDGEVLAAELRKECTERGADVQVYSSLQTCLKALGAPAAEAGPEAMRQAVLRLTMPAMYEKAADKGLVLGKAYRTSVEPFSGEGSDLVGVQFDISFQAEDAAGALAGQKQGALIVVKGECQYIPSQGRAVNARLDSMEVSWSDKSGERHQSVTVYVGGALAFAGSLSARKIHADGTIEEVGQL